MMAVDTSQLRRRVLRYAEDVQREAVDRVMVGLDARHPHDYSGNLSRDVARSDRSLGTQFATSLKQGPGGGDRPVALPQWLDEGRQFVIRPRRRRMLRFVNRGGQVVFARQVLWNREQRSRGFWSDTVNQETWDRALEETARNRPLPP